MCFISEVSQLDLLECAFVDVFQSNDIIVEDVCCYVIQMLF